MAPTRFEFRLDDALKASAKAEADEIGVDLSEFVRSAIELRLAWNTAIRAIQAGVDPELLMDPKRLAGVLNEVAQRQDPGNEKRPPRR